MGTAQIAAFLIALWGHFDLVEAILIEVLQTAANKSALQRSFQFTDVAWP